MQRCLHFSTFWYSSYYLKRVTTSKIEISTFDVVIIVNAIGKFRTSKWCFSWIFKEFISMFWIYLWRHKRSERRKSPLSKNISMFWFYLWRWKGSLRRKSIFNAIFDVLIVGVLINSKDIFDVLISMFWSTKKTILTFWNFGPVEVLIVDVPTPSHLIVGSFVMF